MTGRYDIAIVGAGMAGASLAAHLAGNARVVVIEGEDRPGYHTTGRSAAFWSESYGGPLVQPLTTASGPFLRDGGFLSSRQALTIGRGGQEARVEAFAARFAARGVEVAVLDRAELEARIPGLRAGWTSGALEPSCRDIDVAALHQHYLRQARRGGAEILTRARLASARRDGPGWRLELDGGRSIACGVIVNAAGAWADPVARLCGVREIGIAPLRRTMVQISVSPPAPPSLPLVLDVDEKFYFKPEGGGLWLSPHDETPSPPCDAAPDEIDVAMAIDRLEGVVDWKVERVGRRWAGLRSFAPDRLPVIGFADGDPGFFWFAGQGGFGIQTAPATAAMGAAMLLGDKTVGCDIDPAPYRADRFK